MFDALDKFLMKMKEVDQRFMAFPHNLSYYSTLDNLPSLIKKPEDLPPKSMTGLSTFRKPSPVSKEGMSI